MLIEIGTLAHYRLPLAHRSFWSICRKERLNANNIEKAGENVESGQIAMQVARTIASEASASYRIAMLPISGGVKLLRQWIREEEQSDMMLFDKAIVEVGTVHQFQGSEADAVVFDLVDGPGRSRLGLLLRGDTGTRLVNVAD